MVVGAMAIALLAMTTYSAQAILQEEESESYVAAMGDVKRAWTNAMLVSDQIVEDVGLDLGCAAVPDISSAIDGNLQSAKNTFDSSDLGIDCTMARGGDPVIAGNITVDIEIECTKEIAVEIGTEIEMLFRANFKKTVTIQQNC